MVAAAALAFSASAAAAVPTGNLLQDPGAELDGGSTDSACGANATLGAAWTGQPGFTAVRYGTGSYPDQSVSNSIGGGQNFFTGGCAPETTASQVIDVSAYTADFDAGQIQAALSADLGGYLTQEDSADVYATFEPCGDNPALGTIAIGPVTAAERNNQTTLLPRTSLGMVPAGTCSINVVMHFLRASGTTDDGYADNLSLSLTDLSTHTLTVNVAGAGTGSVAGDQAPQIQCQPMCQQAYAPGTTVTLTETPSPGSAFTGWSGGVCSGTASTCTVTVYADTDRERDLRSRDRAVGPAQHDAARDLRHRPPVRGAQHRRRCVERRRHRARLPVAALCHVDRERLQRDSGRNRIFLHAHRG